MPAGVLVFLVAVALAGFGTCVRWGTRAWLRDVLVLLAMIAGMLLALYLVGLAGF